MAGWGDWGKPAKPVAQVSLRFRPGTHADLMGNLSAGTRIGNSLFLGADEQCLLNLFVADGTGWREEEPVSLASLLDLADAEGEADLEGLAVDGDWLWLVGSHARTRPKPEKAKDECIDLEALADLKDTRPRCLLARVPLVAAGDGVFAPVRADGARRAGLLEQGKHGNALTRALKADPLIAPFLKVPAKEGGLDVEGLAICNGRVALGLRGPVIASHAVLLELTIRVKKSGALKLQGTPAKRLLAMEGLGIRDLKRCGDDLLILAGPTTALSGPCALYRWRNWANEPAENVERVRLHRPERLFEVPFGRRCDHPEGLALYPDEGSGAGILVIYDSPAKERVDEAAGTVLADLFRLPA